MEHHSITGNASREDSFTHLRPTSVRAPGRIVQRAHKAEMCVRVRAADNLIKRVAVFGGLSSH